MRDPFDQLYYTLRPANPVMRALAFVGGLAVLAVLTFFGLIFFAVLLAVFALVAAVVSARMWWLGRKLRKSGRETDSRAAGSHPYVIEGKYVVRRYSSERDRPNEPPD